MNRAESGGVEPSHKIQQSGFAGAGTAEQRQKFAGRNGERNVVHGANTRFAHYVMARHMIDLNRGLDGCLLGWRCANRHSLTHKNTTYDELQRLQCLMRRSCEVLSAKRCRTLCGYGIECGRLRRLT